MAESKDSKDGMKANWKKYALYAGVGLAVGVTAWLAYKHFSKTTATAAPGAAAPAAAAGITKSDSGNSHVGNGNFYNVAGRKAKGPCGPGCASRPGDRDCTGC